MLFVSRLFQRAIETSYWFKLNNMHQLTEEERDKLVKRFMVI